MPVSPDYMVYGPAEEETRPTMEMPIEDVNNLDEVVRELGIESSEETPAEAVRKLKAEKESLKKALYELLHVSLPPASNEPELLVAHHKAVIEGCDLLGIDPGPEYRHARTI